MQKPSGCLSDLFLFSHAQVYHPALRPVTSASTCENDIENLHRKYHTCSISMHRFESLEPPWLIVLSILKLVCFNITNCGLKSTVYLL